jgi:hypothetical protein
VQGVEKVTPLPEAEAFPYAPLSAASPHKKLLIVCSYSLW